MKTKQEEIREGMARFLAKFDGYDWDDLEVTGKDPILNLGTKQDYLLRAEKLLDYENSQGVVIKVEKELPDNEAWHRIEREFEAYCAGKNELIGAGYVAVEPLLKSKRGLEDKNARI